MFKKPSTDRAKSNIIGLSVSRLEATPFQSGCDCRIHTSSPLQAPTVTPPPTTVPPPRRCLPRPRLRTCLTCLSILVVGCLIVSLAAVIEHYLGDSYCLVGNTTETIAWWLRLTPENGLPNVVWDCKYLCFRIECGTCYAWSCAIIHQKHFSCS